MLSGIQLSGSSEPTGLRSLALLDPVAAFSRIPLRAIAVALGALPRAPVWWRRRFLEVVGDDPAVGANPETALFAAELGRFAAAMPQPSVATGAELAAVSVPTLVVLGPPGGSGGADRGPAADARLPDRAHQHVRPAPHGSQLFTAGGAGGAVGRGCSSPVTNHGSGSPPCCPVPEPHRDAPAARAGHRSAGHNPGDHHRHGGVHVRHGRITHIADQRDRPIHYGAPRRRAGLPALPRRKRATRTRPLPDSAPRRHRRRRPSDRRAR
jgi:hypothetical protein